MKSILPRILGELNSKGFIASLPRERLAEGLAEGADKDAGYERPTVLATR